MLKMQAAQRCAGSRRQINRATLRKTVPVPKRVVIRANTSSDSPVETIPALAVVAEVPAVSTVVPAKDEMGPSDLVYVKPSSSQEFWTKFKLSFARPWRRFKSGSVLAFKIEGDISDQSKGFFSAPNSVPQICRALRQAALDPRVSGLCIEISPLAIGWAKMTEITRHIEYFRASGKFTIAYIKQGGEKEYYLASACEEVYIPPSAYLSLLGFSVAGTFLRGFLDKVGVEPQVKRIGNYKSAGDQLLRSDMSEYQREASTALLDSVYQNFLTGVAKQRGKTREEVSELLESGVYNLEQLAKGGWVNGLKYEDELMEDLKLRTGGKPEELRKVGLKKMTSVSPSAYGLNGKKRIVVLRTAGNIVGQSSNSSNSITPGSLIPLLRALAKDKKIAAVVLRVDSPGGDAYASDLMWREIRKLGEKKPIIASMGDVAASGGYYLAMAANKIVAEPLTITGSIGVITGKLNAAVLYAKIGISKTLLSRGKYAQLASADNRSFTLDEEELFSKGATYAYESFRNKAAESRGMEPLEMEKFAQGRVWTGSDALKAGLVDALGGITKAIEMAKAAAEIPAEENVTIIELGQVKRSPLSLIGGGASVSSALSALSASLSSGTSVSAALGIAAATLLSESSSSSTAASLSELMLTPGQVNYTMTDVDASTLGSTTPTAIVSTGEFLNEDGNAYGMDADSWLQKLL